MVSKEVTRPARARAKAFVLRTREHRDPSHHFNAKEYSSEGMIVGSGALGVSDIQTVPGPVACSKRRA
jgi:hypothetical protein